MTFQDDFQEGGDQQMYRSLQFVHLWLRTCAPVSSKLGLDTIENLEKVAKELGYPIYYDDSVGFNVIGKEK